MNVDEIGGGEGGRDWQIYKCFTLKTLNEPTRSADLDVILNTFYGIKIGFMVWIHVYRNRVEHW